MSTDVIGVAAGICHARARSSDAIIIRVLAVNPFAPQVASIIKGIATVVTTVA